jgi:hypothetical protein
MQLLGRLYVHEIETEFVLILKLDGIKIESYNGDLNKTSAKGNYSGCSLMI